MQWQQQYAPRTPDEEPHPRFMEAIRNLEMVEYDLDLLQGGEEPEKLEKLRFRILYQIPRLPAG